VSIHDLNADGILGNAFISLAAESRVRFNSSIQEDARLLTNETGYFIIFKSKETRIHTSFHNSTGSF